MRRKNLIAALVMLGIAGCALGPNRTNKRPIPVSGSFQVALDQGAQFFSDTEQYPIAGHLVDNVPYIKQQIIPAGAGIIGYYKNGGFRCSIIWTAIILADNTAISNSNGVAFSSCPARRSLTESQVITAKWN